MIANIHIKAGEITATKVKNLSGENLGETNQVAIDNAKCKKCMHNDKAAPHHAQYGISRFILTEG